MGTSEVHLPEGENLIGVCCSDELHFFSLFYFFFPNHCAKDAREIIGVRKRLYSMKITKQKR